ncbi:DNA-directed RNA polymerase III subunit RPC9 isoform X2 [Zalophus californianus]|uniref:DNA-directed RNA polymerase III subunit RPC9 n=1 Tax=Zalophus californianus TaxID=9704 RepID=A0A6J2EJH7_ZALCA|nr:DNA-directed RNA polymerase III subunit RPC9 isoform X2 [Zalophus californianus]
MEVKDANSALLSNYEVFQLLTDLKEQRKESGKNKHSSGQQNLNTITYETLKYISKTPCRHQSPEIVREFLTAMKSHKLTKERHTTKEGTQQWGVGEGEAGLPRSREPDAGLDPGTPGSRPEPKADA